MQAMKTLKIILTTASALKSIEYEEERDEIIYVINASEKKWEEVLMQKKRNEKCYHIICYESRLWLKVEKEYDVKKHKSCDVLKMLKKCWKYLYKIQFVLKIDVNILIAQLNRTASNLSEALIMCWIVWIQLFDFIMQHVSDTKHKAADELLQKSKIKRKFENDENIDNFINTQLNIVTIFTLTAENSCEEILNAEYSSEHQQIMYYLTILCKFSEITSSNFWEFKKKVFWFLVQKIHLFCWQKRNVLFRCVVNSEQMK